jgi:hypothetical protein
MMLHRLARGRNSRCAGVAGVGLVMVGAIVLTAAGPAQARTHAGARPRPAKVDHACAAAHSQAQAQERDGHLRAASQQLAICARAVCGELIARECAVRHAQLEIEIPSIVPLASDDAGAPLVDVQVTMDGQLLASRLDGRAIPVDPGLHEFAFRMPGGALEVQKIVIAQGQRNRPVSVPASRPSAPRASAAVAPERALETERATMVEPRRTGAALAEPAEAADRRTSASVQEPARLPMRGSAMEASSSHWVAPTLLGVVGLAGVGGYGLLTYWGRRDNDRLAQCSPDCAQASVDHIRRLYLGADVSLGVGLVALAATTWMVFHSEPARERTARAEPGRSPPRPTALELDVRPTTAGAWAAIGGRF